MNLALDTDRGARAERILSDELLQEAFAELETAYTQAWRDTAVRDTDARERLWQALQIVGKVRSHIEIVARDGKVAQAELAEIEKLGEVKQFKPMRRRA
mgnify:CR=1 FL=1